MLKSPLDQFVDHNLLILLQNMHIDLERRAPLGVSQGHLHRDFNAHSIR